MTPSIEQLPAVVAGLPPETQRIFNRIFSVDVVKGILCAPQPMLQWIEQQFGSVEKVIAQPLVKVTNRISLEQSVFNPLRSLRPHNFRGSGGDMQAKPGSDSPFATPLQKTTENPFGRVQGQYCVTAGNVASYEQYHCVIIFNNADPLDFSRNQVADYLETGWRWMQLAHNYDPAACYGLFLWNCNGRAGASISHGHAQVVLSRYSHYARVEHLRAAALDYSDRYGSSYFDDLFSVHEAMGLGFASGDAKVMACLSPLKLSEVTVVADSLSADAREAVYRVLACFRDQLKVTAFNVGIAFPPLDMEKGWESFPVIARMLDRGGQGDLSSDIGAMEFWGASVISSDPFDTARALLAAFKTG